MLRRYRCFYAKITALIIAFLVFSIYLKVLQIERGTSSFSSYVEKLVLKQNSLRHIERQSNKDLNKNEIPGPIPVLHKPQSIELYSEIELSIKRDLEKQVPDLGDLGQAAHLKGAAKIRGEEIYKKIALNDELSQHISYNRTLDDYRHPSCADIHYDLDSLPSASIIIVFYNEPQSVLLRTIHSVLKTCGGPLLKQIILVDDGSTNKELGEKFNYYIKTRIASHKVMVVRLKNRMGLIKARLAGAAVASGDVLIFLDAHCEANIGWCQPLLQRIKESRTSILTPIIDIIDSRNFKYIRNGGETFEVGGFEWSGIFSWIHVSNRERKRQKRECKYHDTNICPTYSPTMAGGLFAIDRNYFWEMGSYDEQMDGWGGENLEMSFRIWQCGGTIETIPCSRVGHIFRDFSPYESPNKRDTHGINTARAALVWMDEYVNLFFLNRPELKFNPDIGNITQRVLLRNKLNCKSFDWYLQNIYPEKFVPTKNVLTYGKVHSLGSDFCLDDLGREYEKAIKLGVQPCDKNIFKQQFFSLTNNGVLRNEFACAAVEFKESKTYSVVMTDCFENDDLNEEWEYSKHHITHVNTGMCLDHEGLQSGDYIRVAVCDRYSMTQNWFIDNRDEILSPLRGQPV